MKKSLLLLFFFCLTATSYAIEVVGIPFGSSYRETYEVLNKKWGKPYGMNFEEIVYMNKLYAGDDWNIVIFRFQGNGGETNIFNCCLFGKQFQSLSDAEVFRDHLVKKLSKSYKVFTKTDEKGIKYYIGGQSPVDPYISAWVLDIHENKVRLIYGPYNYLNERY